MFHTLLHFVPEEGLKIVLVLFLAFLVGLEREEAKGLDGGYLFGGVRTFPLIGLLGFTLTLISPKSLVPLLIGLLVLGAFLVVSYAHKVGTEGGITTELAALITYLMGALVEKDLFWLAATIVIADLLFLETKTALENLSRQVAKEEILTFTKFLLVAVVILPALPDRDFTTFHINPFKTWVIVVAVCAISYGSYILQKVVKKRGGIIVTALLGGAYSSTVATVVLAKKAKNQDGSRLYSGAILLASGVMYLRLCILLLFFNGQLFRRLVIPFLVLAAVACLAGWLWAGVRESTMRDPAESAAPQNPLELKMAFLFAAIFVAVILATALAIRFFGSGGLYTLAVLMGVTDVDPFILGLTQTAGMTTVITVSAAAIVIAAASNNLVKGIYAYVFANRKAGLQSLIFLVLLALLGLLPLLLL